MSYPRTGRVVSRAFYGKNGEVLEETTEQLLDLRLQINDIRADQHERISNLEEQVNKQKEINKFLEAYSDRMAAELEKLREKTWKLENTIGALKLRIGNLEQPGEPSDHPDIETDEYYGNNDREESDQDNQQSYSLRSTESDRESYDNNQYYNGYQDTDTGSRTHKMHVYEFLEGAYTNNKISSDMLQELTNLFDHVELPFRDTQTPDETTKTLLQTARDLELLTKKQYKRLIRHLQE